MGAKEKQAAAKQTFAFPAPLTNGPSAQADSRVHQHVSMSLYTMAKGENKTI